MTREGSKYKFNCSGRTFYANGYIGAVLDDSGYVEIAEGYDGHVSLDQGLKDDEDWGWLTQEEITELSDYMIGVWTIFKNQHATSNE